MSTQLSEYLDVAAQLGAIGLDAMRFIETQDEDDRNFMLELGKRIAEHKSKMNHSMAVDIANQVGKLFK